MLSMMVIIRVIPAQPGVISNVAVALVLRHSPKNIRIVEGITP